MKCDHNMSPWLCICSLWCSPSFRHATALSYAGWLWLCCSGSQCWASRLPLWNGEDTLLSICVTLSCRPQGNVSFCLQSLLQVLRKHLFDFVFQPPLTLARDQGEREYREKLRQGQQVANSEGNVNSYSPLLSEPLLPNSHLHAQAHQFSFIYESSLISFLDLHANEPANSLL